VRVLLDEQLPLDLAAALQGHSVDTVAGRGWTGITNGELLQRMVGEYDALVTMDRGTSSRSCRQFSPRSRHSNQVNSIA
jgi:hypothetical protein